MQAHHKPVAEIAQNGDLDPIGDLKECGPLYEDLELCLAENNRDFSKCNHITKAVRMCMIAQAQQAKAASKGSTTASSAEQPTSPPS